MLESIHLENYRGFKNHKLDLRTETIIVGANNAGKSTVVEAIRLVSLVANRYKNLTYKRPSPGSGVPMANEVVSPSLENFNINFDNLFYLLGDPPSIITAQFTGGEITIFITGMKKLYAVVKNPIGESVRNKTAANKIDLDKINILPQVGPLARDEKILSSDYIRANISSVLAPLHFRNQLRLMPEYWPEFTRLVAETWPGLRIVELVIGNGLPGDALGLLVNDGNFCAEVSWMGHGVQMWLQTIWFLARTPRDTCVVIDEPDVYLHPDLQRRLVRLIRPRYNQVVIATHSIEIMSEVDPREILIQTH